MLSQLRYGLVEILVLLSDLKVLTAICLPYSSHYRSTRHFLQRQLDLAVLEHVLISFMYLLYNMKK
jgi:hypothetical protein